MTRRCSETVIEAAYQAVMVSGFTIQSDMQMIPHQAAAL